jgi:hypothetical protein
MPPVLDVLYLDVPHRLDEIHLEYV